jgi:hypothetical protein
MSGYEGFAHALCASSWLAGALAAIPDSLSRKALEKRQCADNTRTVCLLTYLLTYLYTSLLIYSTEHSPS